VLTSHLIFAQQYVFNGSVIDKSSKRILSFANIRVGGTTIGTSANVEGNFELKLKEGIYSIIVSYIGYKSDTLKNVNLSKNVSELIELDPIDIVLPEVTVKPGINPALEIIRKTIAARHEREEKLNSYIFKAYTKGMIKTTKEISSTDRSIGLSIGESDTAKLKITGIIENESMGYFKKPDFYKDEIIARKQSSNTQSSINVVTGGRLLQNFYSNDIRFFNRSLTGPISDDALDYYYFYIEETLVQDNQRIFKIYFAPDDESDPGFYGRVYIADSIFSLVKVDVDLNSAANPGGIFSKVNVFQQFLPYEDNIYMPIDYRVFAEGNYLGLVKFGFELNSIFYNYEINPSINDDFFDMAVITVLPEADDKDSLYWQNTQTIPNTLEETKAYKRIDSLEAVPKTFWDRFSILSTRTPLTDNFSISGPLSLYHFNRVEGSALDFGFYLSRAYNKRLNGSLDLSYGFSDNKIKSELFSRYYLGEYRTHNISLRVFNKLDELFGTSDKYNQLTSTILNLVSKYDFRNYYYSKGFNANITSLVIPILQLGIGFLNRTDNSAFVNTDFAFFKKDKSYRENPPIYETKINALTASFRLDFRKYIEDGYFRRRTSLGKSFSILSGDLTFSNSDLLKSNLDFEMYKFRWWTYLNTFKSTGLTIDINSLYSKGPIPYQMLYALPGNINLSGKAFTFRTLEIGEVFGDRVVTVNVQQFFGDELFKLSKIPILKDLQLILGAHLNIAWLDISKNTRAILSETYKTFKHPFYEAGFSIGHMIIPMRFEFTWKLNYRGHNNFVFGINAFVL
jgi:hypothetical protein